MNPIINPLSLDGKRIMVTGASSGIGRACARILAELGATLALSGRDDKRLSDTLDTLPGEGHSIHPFVLGRADGIDDWIDGIAVPGRLDGLVHCAGVEITLPIKALSDALYREVMGVNLDAAFALARAFRRKGSHNPGASLVYVSSVSGMAGQGGHSAYCCQQGRASRLGEKPGRRIHH